MGKIYTRPESEYLWCWYYDARGQRQRKSLQPLKPGQEEEAKTVLKKIERRVRAEKETGVTAEGPLTVDRWAERYLKRLALKSPGAKIDQESHLDNYVLPVLGKELLNTVRPTQIGDLFLDLQGKVAPKTVHNIYGTTRKLFRSAFKAELIDANPCALSVTDGELPERVDADPAWRATAVFSRDEVAALVSDQRLLFDRRMMYGLIFLGGMRFGEAAARTWADYDEALEPLGRLHIHSSFSTRLKVVKEPKKKRAREMPVHPLLAGLLEEWREHGWPQFMGRPPQPQDLIVPTRRGTHRKVNKGLHQLHHDLEMLGFRLRRQHDGRRAFISLARSDGANEGLLRWATHGPRGTTIDEYTTPTWQALCREVAKLQIPLLRSGSRASAPEAVVTALSQQALEMKKPPSLMNLEALFQRGVRDVNPRSRGRARAVRLRDAA